MMPHLQTLDGRPLTWQQVHELNGAYWSRLVICAAPGCGNYRLEGRLMCKRHDG